MIMGNGGVCNGSSQSWLSVGNPGLDFVCYSTCLLVPGNFSFFAGENANDAGQWWCVMGSANHGNQWAILD